MNTIIPNIVIYTSITGDKDSSRIDNIRLFTGEGKFIEPVMEAKIYKVLAHQFIEAEYSIWVDGNIKLLISPEQLVEEWMKDEYEIAVFKHPERNCLYDEAKKIKEIFPPLIPTINMQMKYYHEQKFPEQNGFKECGVIIRKHNKKIEKLNNAWWSEICRWTYRDQLSFTYVLSKFPSLKVNTIEGNVRNHPYFLYNNHLK